MSTSPDQLALAHFKQGSYIMVEGKSDAPVFFIIRSGSVRLQKEAELIEEETGNILNPGDFFGVISTMSNHPRIESALALTDVVLIVVRKDQFGVLIQKNAPIALKIIRSFSRKLRYFDSSLTKMSFLNAVDEDPSHLYSLGEYYDKQRQLPIAAYAYMRYLQYKPQGENVLKAKQRLAQLKEHLKRQESGGEGNFSRTYEDNEVIFLEHETGEELYIIQQGKVKITKIVDNNEIMLAVLEPGDIFGEMAILEDKPRNASALSFGKTVMLAVNKNNFQSMVISQPQLATKIITVLSERIWISYRQFANLLISDPLGRAYDTLLTQLEKNRVPITRGAKYTFNFGAKELIKMVGLDPNTGRQVLRQLSEDRHFNITNEQIEISNLEELQKQTSFFKKKAMIERKMEKQKLERG